MSIQLNDVADGGKQVRVGRDWPLSVILPVFNEKHTVEFVIQQLRRCPLACEIIVVDDGSNDGTWELLCDVAPGPDLVLVRHQDNLGKGSAVRTGLQYIRGRVICIQDADLEYDPLELPRLAEPILRQDADVVYGNRFHKVDVSTPFHRMVNRSISVLCSMFMSTPLKDVETCYKLVRRECFEEIAPTLGEEGFGIEIELAMKLDDVASRPIVEMPIAYFPRDKSSGKKIRWTDGIWALWCIARYGLTKSGARRP